MGCEPQREAAGLTCGMHPDLEFPVHGQLGRGVLHNASVSPHLLPGQTWEDDFCLCEAQAGAIVDPVVLGTGFGNGDTLHAHLGADPSRQDAIADDVTGTQLHFVWPICRDKASLRTVVLTPRDPVSFPQPACGPPPSQPGGAPTLHHEHMQSSCANDHYNYVFCYLHLL